MKRKAKGAKPQRGGFFLGMIVGLLVGLAAALGVALYISKVPIPFVNKVPQRTAEQDAAETEKNKNWDPNNGLYGRNPAKPSSAPAAADGVQAPPPVTSSAPVNSGSAPARRDPADILADKPWPAVTPTPASPPAVDGAASRAGKPDAVATYFVQAGAFSSADDAEQQRGKLALMDMQAKVTERQQAGRTIYRVRMGPFDQREEANRNKEKLAGVGIEAALVQVQK